VPLFYNENISDEMTNMLARRAWFSMNVTQHDDTGMDGVEGVEWRLAGEGVDVIDEAVTILQNGTVGSLFNIQPTVFLDYGAVGEELYQVGVSNLQRLRSAFCSIYGTVNRPDVYAPFGEFNGVP
jgi:hypothetical protein